MNNPDELLPFDLEAALAGAEIVTRSGIPVTDLAYFKSLTTSAHKIRAIVNGELRAFTIAGRFASGDRPSDFDLFIKPKYHKLYCNIWYHIKDKCMYLTEFDSELKAQAAVDREASDTMSNYKFIKHVEILISDKELRDAGIK